WVTQRPYGFAEWLAADPTRRTIVITQNLVPDDVATTPDWRALGASGAYNRYARELARTLVRTGFGYSVVRLGAEMNGPWETDWVGNGITNQREWARYFAQIVRTMRSVKGAHFLFDWNVNAAYEDIPLANYYPGNRYVDIVGADAYDEAPIPLPPVGSPSRWPTLVSQPVGLDSIYAFAARHHKPLSVPEWATLAQSGDDGQYVTRMGQFILTHDVAYQSWFDNGDNGISPLDAAVAPRSLAAYVAYFGPRSRIARFQRSYYSSG
ncbi:MAG TPA: glycosyl hydrolase, partial [Acidimicrobiales bacterium]|nr:glycosyl hydrolase [Acidimicrobiales bacterium]